MQSNNTTGYKGVYRAGKAWKSLIGINKRLIYLGTFPTPEAAYAAYCEAANTYHGEFARPA